MEESIKNVELFCLHGPPGTGKTTTISNIISEFAARDMKILVTCPSNAAVDVLVEKCIHKKIRVIRLGHPVRTSQHLRAWTLDAHLNESEVLTDLKKEIKTAQGRERGELRKELRQREQKICKVVYLLWVTISNSFFVFFKAFSCEIVARQAFQLPSD